MSFEIDGGDSYKSYLGSLLSLVIIIVTGSYTFLRFNKMREYGDSVH